jgi:hypothetical protein
VENGKPKTDRKKAGREHTADIELGGSLTRGRTMKSEADDFDAYNDVDLKVLVQSYKQEIVDVTEQIEGKQEGGVMDRVRREAIADLQDDLEWKQGRLAQIEAEQKRRAEAV